MWSFPNTKRFKGMSSLGLKSRDSLKRVVPEAQIVTWDEFYG
jgi:hypothetical protein